MANKRVVFLDNRPFLKELYEVNLKTYLSADIVTFEEIEACQEYLKGNTFDVFICRNEIDDKPLPPKFKPIFSDRDPKSFLFIVLGEGKNKMLDAYEDYEVIPDSAEVRELLRTIAGFLGITALEMASVSVPHYYPLPTKLFIPGFVLKNSLYKKTNEGYKTILAQGKKIHPEIIELLVDSGHEEVFVEALDRLKVVNQLSAFLLETLRNEFITTEGRIDVTFRSMSIVHETLRNIGIDSKTMELAEESIKSMDKLINEISDLKSLMKNLMEGDFTYTYKHCLLNIFISHHIIDAMEWGSDEQKEKATYVGFFHDIALGKDEYSKIHTEKDIEKVPDEKEQQLIRGHALISAKIISRYKQLPMGVDVIIKQHHGSPTGIGLDKKPSGISPLACIFMVAEEWSSFIIQNEELGGRLARDKIIAYMNEKYNYKGFDEILAVLTKLKL